MSRDLLLDHRHWQQASLAEQDAVLRDLAAALPDCELLGGVVSVQGGLAQRVGAFRQRASGVVLHLIPGGSHALGQEPALEREAPPRRVELAPFLLGRFPVRQEEWDRLGGDDRRPVAGADLPVSGVSWDAAQDWCARAGLRLPREDEWEAACRAGSVTPFYWGPAFEPAYAWVLDNAQRQPQPVSAHRPYANGYGLVDMSGNVSEWCQEQLDVPMQGSDWQEWDPGRVHRGGSFEYPSRCCRSSFRGGTQPQRSYPDLGLRAARDVPALA